MPIADVLQDVDDSYGLSQGGARMNTEEANIHDEDAKRPATMLMVGANESCSNNGKTDNDDVVCSVEIIADENGLTDMIASIDLMEDVTIDLTQNTADSTEAITRAYDVCEEDDDVSS